MDLTEKGWLPKYMEYRSSMEHVYNPDSLPLGKALYRIFHPTGLMFGHPLFMPDYVDIDLEQWPVLEKIKLIFTEGLFAVFCLLNAEKQRNTEAFYDFLIDFYAKAVPGLLKESLPFFKLDKPQKVEKLINRRVKVKAAWNAGFWQGFFQNILLFTDVLALLEYGRGVEPAPARFLENLRYDALTLMAAAAFADGDLDANEKKLFSFFVTAAGLGKLKEKEFLTLTSGRVGLDKVSISQNYSWPVRKYLLELAVLTVWADRNISKKEENFLHDAAAILGFDEEELLISMAAVEGFVMNNWEKVHYLQSKQNYLIISKRLTSRMTKIAAKYKDEIKREVSQSKELIRLLEKSKKSALTAEEKEMVRQQLTDILKAIPAFVFLTLPFSFFALPILFKIIPKSVFPDSFDENKLMKGNKKHIISE